ncbi:helix-turn-helix domain-containing protein [Microbulbifer sp. ALW1]|uniref:helix-turn-helix domain-containing protein n=1 Tax=Microbulbifer sp. (strain ALW1) TaxID=1516059 RepID=UPI001357146A|nr:helix-turn-helix domain-containing protein [Microbulbifer sp. ALW1]
MTDDHYLMREALALMESNLSEPLLTGELAAYLGVSSKKLERVFRRCGFKLPARFYLDLRLERARQLLRGSSLRIDEVGRNCGFSSASHFSRCYREFSGHSPREERKTHAMQASYRLHFHCADYTWLFSAGHPG